MISKVCEYYGEGEVIKWGSQRAFTKKIVISLWRIYSGESLERTLHGLHDCLMIFLCLNCFQCGYSKGWSLFIVVCELENRWKKRHFRHSRPTFWWVWWRTWNNFWIGAIKLLYFWDQGSPCQSCSDREGRQRALVTWGKAATN